MHEPLTAHALDSRCALPGHATIELLYPAGADGTLRPATCPASSACSASAAVMCSACGCGSCLHTWTYSCSLTACSGASLGDGLLGGPLLVWPHVWCQCGRLFCHQVQPVPSITPPFPPARPWCCQPPMAATVWAWAMMHPSLAWRCQTCTAWRAPWGALRHWFCWSCQVGVGMILLPLSLCMALLWACAPASLPCDCCPCAGHDLATAMPAMPYNVPAAGLFKRGAGPRGRIPLQHGDACHGMHCGIIVPEPCVNLLPPAVPRQRPG